MTDLKKSGPKRTYLTYHKNWKWPYKDETDPRYIKDKRELFEKNKNGWFIYRVNGIIIPEEFRV